MLSASELLNIWELGLTQEPVERALTLLSASCPEKTLDDLARLPIGQRDALLLSFREKTFGFILTGLAACPHCGQNLEMSFEIGDVRVKSAINPVKELVASLDDYEVKFRLPSSLDMIAVVDLPDSNEVIQVLIERCLLKSNYKSEEISVKLLPATVIDEVSRRMAEADPQADVQLALSCPACEHKWEETFDIQSFLWKEIDAWARRILKDVHVLASAHGWSEAEILAMSSLRRQTYLDMVNL